MVRRLTDIIKEQDIAVHTLCSYPDLTDSIKMEVGIEDCLHIEFEYNKSKYHLQDVIVGKIYFILGMFIYINQPCGVQKTINYNLNNC